jgi:hypothetical protein
LLHLARHALEDHRGGQAYGEADEGGGDRDREAHLERAEIEPARQDLDIVGDRGRVFLDQAVGGDRDQRQKLEHEDDDEERHGREPGEKLRLEADVGHG